MTFSLWHDKWSREGLDNLGSVAIIRLRVGRAGVLVRWLFDKSVAPWREVVGRASFGGELGKPSKDGTASSRRDVRSRVLSLELEGMILAQSERWRRGLGMQVVGETRLLVGE